MIEWIVNKADTNCFLSGRDYEKKNQVAVWTIGDDMAAVVLSVGKDVRSHPFGRPNEDSAGAVYIKDDDCFFGIVADSHFGGLISDAVVQTCVKRVADREYPLIKENNTPGENAGKLRKYLEKSIATTLETTLPTIAEKDRGAAGETTLFAAFVQEKRLTFGTIGDSVLYLFSKNERILLKHRYPEFLHELYFNPESLETESRNLEPGTTLVLATDGLPECVYGKVTLMPEDMVRCLDKSPVMTARRLVELAFSKGGEDNIGLVVYRVPG